MVILESRDEFGTHVRQHQHEERQDLDSPRSSRSQHQNRYCTMNFPPQRSRSFLAHSSAAASDPILSAGLGPSMSAEDPRISDSVSRRFIVSSQAMHDPDRLGSRCKSEIDKRCATAWNGHRKRPAWHGAEAQAWRDLPFYGPQPAYTNKEQAGTASSSEADPFSSRIIVNSLVGTRFEALAGTVHLDPPPRRLQGMRSRAGEWHKLGRELRRKCCELYASLFSKQRAVSTQDRLRGGSCLPFSREGRIKAVGALKPRRRKVPTNMDGCCLVI